MSSIRFFFGIWATVACGLLVGAIGAIAYHSPNNVLCTAANCIYGDAEQDVFDTDGSHNIWMNGGDDMVLEAKGGDDDLHGEGGSEYMAANAGFDELAGGGESDYWRLDGVCCYGLYGQGGQEQMGGAHGDDVMNGGDSDDAMYGGDGNDVLDGGDNNDYLSAGDGYDKCFPGPGDDTAVSCEEVGG